MKRAIRSVTIELTWEENIPDSSESNKEQSERLAAKHMQELQRFLALEKLLIEKVHATNINIKEINLSILDDNDKRCSI